ncbi:MAG: hypothetical protein EHM93_06270 [Bacteroidales bacterium]|nr:MAG: hypothetical protein EHM93_06270 [Bacteroidales bacterium]
MINNLILNKETIWIKKIDEIKTTLDICVYDDFKASSIMGGPSGIALFNFYYSKFKNEQSSYDIGYELIGKIFESINSGKNNYSFSGGVAGIGWLIEHLKEQEFIDSNCNEMLCELDDLVYEKMTQDIQSRNFDYLHGALGFGLYFLSRLKERSNIENYLIKLVDELEKISTLDINDGIKWPPLLINDDNKGVISNLSLSHGMASIVAFLSRVYRNNILKEKSYRLLNGAIIYILNNKLDLLNFHSCFPSMIFEVNKPSSSRLAWCYGDLGIGISIYQAGIATDNNQWVNKGIEILLHSTKRINYNTTYVVDAGLCHGTAGIAHIYNRMYRYTKNSTFKEAADFWFLKTLEMANFEDGLAGYKAWRNKETGGDLNEAGLLEGISGIGLALISYISDIDPAWDECLLLS